MRARWGFVLLVLALFELTPRGPQFSEKAVAPKRFPPPSLSLEGEGSRGVRGLMWEGASIALAQETLSQSELQELKREALAVFSQILRAGSSAERLGAVNSLVRNGDDSVVPLLAEQLLHDEAPFVRRAAAEGLFRFRSPGAASALRQAALHDEIHSIRWAAAISLQEPSVIVALLQEQATIAAAAVSLQEATFTAKFPSALWPTAETSFLRAFPDRERYNVVERAAMLKALAQLGSLAAISLLRETVNNSDEDPFVRGTAAFTLGALGVRNAVPDLVLALNTDFEAMQAGAAKALGLLGDPYALEALQKTLREARSAEARSAAASALASLGPRAVSALSQALQNDTSPAVRQAAIRSLAQIGGQEASHAVLNFLKGTYLQQCDPTACGSLALETIRALASLGEAQLALALTQATVSALRDALPFLFVFAERDLVHTLSLVGSVAPELFVLLLKDLSPFVRALGISSLAQVRGGEAREILLQYITPQENPIVRRAALEGLSLWAFSDDIELCAPFVTDRDPRTRAAVLAMIARVGDARASVLLRAALRSESIAIRSDAAGASLAFAIRLTRSSIPQTP